ncbi:hypothetical protein FOL47_005262, partial [Perkinsus chesapeaki]
NVAQPGREVLASARSFSDPGRQEYAGAGCSYHFKQLFALKECALSPPDPADLLVERKGGECITLTGVKDSLNSMDNVKAPGRTWQVEGGRKDAGNYRGINLLDYIGKVYAGVLGQGLKPLAESFVGEK